MDWNRQPKDEAEWEPWRRVRGKFNRAVFFNADMYHRSVLAGFGQSFEDGRLTQVAFF